MISLSALGFIAIIVFLGLIMSKRLTAFSALIFIPIVFGLVAGFGPQLGSMMAKGLVGVAPTAILMLFAILFFGVVSDAGLFDPVIKGIMKAVKGDPVRVTVGTAVLAAAASLEGEGAVTIMITITAMLPLYRRLGMRPVVLAMITLFTIGLKSLVPWAGPAARIMTSLQVEAPDLFNPLIPSLVLGFVYAMFASYWLGKIEQKRLGVVHVDEMALSEMASTLLAEGADLKRPKLLWVNLLLTVAIMVGVVQRWLPTSVLFVIGTALALIINYRSLKDQQARLAAHAKGALTVVGVVFAAGIFMGIFTGTKTVDAMAASLITIIPVTWGPHMALLTAIISGPAAFLLSVDAFYFGVLPILAKTASIYGISTIEVARASMMGLPIHILTPLTGTIWLLLGMLDITWDEMFKFCLPWMVGMSLVFMITAMMLGAFAF